MAEKGKRRRQFTAKFKRDTVELVRTTGRPIAHVAAELGIAVANLRVAVTERIQQDGQWRDPTAGGRQFFLLRAAQPWSQPFVDAVPAAPGVDRLGADPQGLGNLSDRPSGLDHVEDLTAELWR